MEHTGQAPTVAVTNAVIRSLRLQLLTKQVEKLSLEVADLRRQSGAYGIYNSRARIMPRRFDSLRNDKESENVSQHRLWRASMFQL